MSDEFDAEAQVRSRWHAPGRLAVHYANLSGTPKPHCRWNPQPGWLLTGDPRNVTCGSCIAQAALEWRTYWQRPYAELSLAQRMVLARATEFEHTVQQEVA